MKQIYFLRDNSQYLLQYLKKVYCGLSIIFSISFIFLISTSYYQLISQEVQLLGNDLVNRPSFIKQFDNHIYFISFNENNVSHLHKRDLNGQEIWSCPLTSDFYASDFTKINNRIILVGRTEIAWGTNTNSVIASIDDLGNSYSQIEAKEYNQNKRDGFFRVAKHPTNSNQVIVGGSTIDINSFSKDDLNLIVFDTNLNVQSYSKYHNNDDQFWSGLKEDQMEITSLGNLGSTNRGCIVNYNNDLNVRNSFTYNNISELFDYWDISNNRKIIVGRTSDSKGIIAELNSLGQANWAKIIDGTKNIYGIIHKESSIINGGTREEFYLRGNDVNNKAILLKINVDNTNLTSGEWGQASPINLNNNESDKKSLSFSTNVSIQWAKESEIDGVSSISTSFNYHNNNIYALNRFQNLPSGYGGDDISFSKTDSEYNSCISIPVNYTMSNIQISPQAFSITKSTSTLPTPIIQTFIPTPEEYSKQRICIPSECLADTLNINTGYHNPGDSVYTTMTQDGFWILEDACQDNGPVSLGSPAWNIEKHPAWSAPGYNSTYISAFPDPGSNLANINTGDPYKFRRCFCSTEPNTEVSFNINVHVDNQMKFFLYDPSTSTQTLLGEVTNNSNSNNFKGVPEHLAINPIMIGSPGQYCVEAELRNDHNRTPMGINIEGWISGNGILKDECCNQASYITGYKYRDQDCDGQVSFDDPIVSDWEITLLDAEGNFISKDTTDSNGYYVFEVPEGYYMVKEEMKNDWEFSTPTNGETDIFQVVTNEVVQKDFGNIYIGPLETKPLESSCAESESKIVFEWRGKTCDCDMTLMYKYCNLDEPYRAIEDFRNTGSYSFTIPDYLLGEVEFSLIDCEGNSVPFDGCVSINSYDLSAAAIQTDCGIYEFSYTIDGIEQSDIMNVIWNFGVIGSSTEINPSFIFDNPGQYIISIEIETLDGCKLTTNMNLDVDKGANDEDCNFCPPNVLSEIEQGDLFIYDECFGLIIKSPSGSCFRIKISDEGQIFGQALTCPDAPITPGN